MTTGETPLSKASGHILSSLSKEDPFFFPTRPRQGLNCRSARILIWTKYMAKDSRFQAGSIRPP